jgi:quinohemoprotein ethanol dehydrogenase
MGIKAELSVAAAPGANRSTGKFMRIPSLLAVALLALMPASVFGAAPKQPVGAGDDWTGNGGDSDETGYSRLDRINRANIGKLGLIWSLDLPGEATLEAVPLAVDGVLYFTGSYAAVYAVDAATGKLFWKYDPET